SAPWVQRRVSLGLGFLLPLWVTALVWPFFLLAPSALFLGICAAILAGAGPIANTIGITYRAALIPNRLQGRVIGAYRVAIFGAVPVGAALTGVSLQKLGTRPTVLIIACGLAITAALATMNHSIRTA